MNVRARRRFSLAVLLALAASMIAPPAAISAPKIRGPQTVVDVEFLGEVVVPTGTTFEGTEIGGLSSIAYDKRRRVYYVVSDDQGNRPTGDPVRFYTLSVDLTDGTFGDGDLEFVDTTEIFERRRIPFAPGGLDPEGLAVAGRRHLFISSEGNSSADPIIDPFIRRYNRRGQLTTKLPIPDHYLSNGVDRGVRTNLAFESLSVTPDEKRLVTANEGALFQDGPASSFTNGSLARILVYIVPQRRASAEYVYEVGPWAEPSSIFGVNGIVEILPIDNAGTMLVMERSFSVGGTLGGGTGNVVVINEISTANATDVLRVDALYEGGSPIPLTPVSKREVFAFDDLGIPIDNIEGMTFGPTLADGRRSVVIVSDNNFGAGQFTQFMVLALDIGPAD